MKTTFLSKAFAFIKKEFLEMLPPTIFFFVVFVVVLLTRALMAKQYGIAFTSSAAAIIGALIVGKSILIADTLPFVNLFHEKILIYNVLWRTFLYLSIVVLFQFLEELIPLVSKHGANATAIEELSKEMKWHQFWATNILFSLFLIFYNLAAATVEVVGRNALMEMFFGSRSNPFNKNV